MRVVIIKHQVTGEELICANIEEALETIERCLVKQDGRRVVDRQPITIELGAMPKADFEELPETTRC